MSKEVKLGLAIGGILLSVMLVYVLVVSGDPATPEQVSFERPSTPAVEQPVPPPVVTEATQPPAPPVTPESPATGTPQPPTIVAENTTPEVKDDRWIRLLSERMEETITPAPEPVANPARDTGPSIGGAVPPTTPEVRTSEPPVVAPPLSNAPRKHTVQRNETYSSIAAAAYGNASFFAHLIRANPGIDPAKLRPGMEIVLPPESEVRGSAQATRTEQQTRTIDGRTEYRVQGADNLYKISMKLYGKPDRIDALYDANKAAIGPDKAKLKPGTILKLPEAPTVASTQ